MVSHSLLRPPPSSPGPVAPVACWACSQVTSSFESTEKRPWTQTAPSLVQEWGLMALFGMAESGPVLGCKKNTTKGHVIEIQDIFIELLVSAWLVPDSEHRVEIVPPPPLYKNVLLRWVFFPVCCLNWMVFLCLPSHTDWPMLAFHYNLLGFCDSPVVQLMCDVHTGSFTHRLPMHGLEPALLQPVNCVFRS